MIPLSKQFNDLKGYNIVSNLKTNLNCNFYANQLIYKKIGNIVFCYLIINAQPYTNNSEEDFELEMPFTFINNWFFPNIKAAVNKSYYFRCVPNTNKIKLVGDLYSEIPVKVKDVGSGFIIYAQFFAFVQD